MNWKKTSPCDDWDGRSVGSVVHFLTIENNSVAKIHATYKEENVINLRNVHCWQSIFQEESTNVHTGEY